ncbi:endoribonuclease YbeY [Spirochaetia bacterium]|nr:endoribonuclease YbeY [Spirochaetia bacterium]
MNNIDICTFDVNEPTQINVSSFMQKVLHALSIDNWNVSVVFCTNSFIANLNKTYRQKDEPTDVLSFCQQDSNDFKSQCKQIEAGDIIISLEYLAANAATFKVSETEELQRLLIHGLLHLKGMDHITNDPSEEMLVLNENLLCELNLH